MSQIAITTNRATGIDIPCSRLLVLTLLLLWNAAARAQVAGPAAIPTAAFSVRATHLLGFEGVPNNAGGSVSIEGDALRFQKDGKPAVQIKIASVQYVSLGQQSKQIGGLPMTIGKAATPYGGGRVISLFAHKMCDTVTLQYADADGAIHGAVFQLGKGEGEVLRNELARRGVRVSPADNNPYKENTGGRG